MFRLLTTLQHICAFHAHLSKLQHGLKRSTRILIFSSSPNDRYGMMRSRPWSTLGLERTNGVLIWSNSMTSWSLSPVSSRLPCRRQTGQQLQKQNFRALITSSGLNQRRTLSSEISALASSRMISMMLRTCSAMEAPPLSLLSCSATKAWEKRTDRRSIWSGST